MQQVVAFFEERRGRLYGFRWQDLTDYESCLPGQSITATDQSLGAGDGTTAVWQLTKTYGQAFAPWARQIRKPVGGTVSVAVNGAPAALGTAFTVDTTTGLVTFALGHVPGAGAAVTAGFEFDVPVRFDNDDIEFTLMPRFGEPVDIPIVEIRA